MKNQTSAPRKTSRWTFPWLNQPTAPINKLRPTKRAFLPGTNEMIPFGPPFFGWVISHVKKPAAIAMIEISWVFLPSINVSPTVFKNHIFFWYNTNQEPPMHPAVFGRNFQNNPSKSPIDESLSKKTQIQDGDTPRKINMEPKNYPIERNIIFQTVPMLIFQGVISTNWILQFRISPGLTIFRGKKSSPASPISELLELLWPPSPYVENPTFPLTSVEWRKFRKDEIKA